MIIKGKGYVGRREEGYYFLLLLVITTATTIPIMIKMMRQMMKQIQRFLRAARAESTAFSVCWTLRNQETSVSENRSGSDKHKPCFQILISHLCLSFDDVDSLVLLFNEYTHLRKHDSS